ncbi:MAG: two-component system NtrC family sensor kinase [Myxococcota bacterium]
MADSSPRRNGLWVEIALALALITLSTILLNAGVFWLLLKRAEEERRTDLVLSLSAALKTQLEVALASEGEAGVRQVFSAYRNSGLEVAELYVVHPSLDTIASLAGEAPHTPDAGLRAALYAKQQYSDVEGTLWGLRWVSVTTPLAPYGRVEAALRVKMPLKAPGVPGGPAGFVLSYTAFSGLIIAFFGFDLFRRRLIGPIASLRAGTERIAGGEFGHQVSLDAARELEELCSALNTMSTSLEAYQQRTVEQVERLEAANTELTRTQVALVRSEKLAGVGRLAAGIAHEVGNPLSAVLGYVELLSSGLGDTELESDLLRRSGRELQRIDRIIRSLLSYARLGPGAPSAVSLSEALDTAVSIVRLRPDCRHIDFHTALSSPELTAWVESDKLQQILLNLLINAAHASKTVWIRASVSDREVVFRCEDDGPGFSAVALERALEPFFTTKEVGAGTGMGLATSQQLISASGGRILLGNRPEGGAIVRFWLPASAPL